MKFYHCESCGTVWKEPETLFFVCPKRGCTAYAIREVPYDAAPLAATWDQVYNGERK